MSDDALFEEWIATDTIDTFEEWLGKDRPRVFRGKTFLPGDIVYIGGDDNCEFIDCTFTGRP